MKQSKIFAVGMLTVLLVMGLVLAGCDLSSSEGSGSSSGGSTSSVAGTTWKGSIPIAGGLTETIHFTSTSFQASRSDGATGSGRYSQFGNEITFETNSGEYMATGYISGNTLSAFGVTYVKQ